MTRTEKRLHEMLRTKGLYAVVSYDDVFFCEVDAEHTCHQLDPDTLEQDWILVQDGWILAAISNIVGPFARQAKDHQ